MTLRKQFLFAVLFLCQAICAQQDSITILDDVLISDLHVGSKYFKEIDFLRFLNFFIFASTYSKVY